MIRRYFYLARTFAGTQHEFYIDENNEETANVQAKIEVERWLTEEGEEPGHLQEFALTHTTP